MRRAAVSFLALLACTVWVAALAAEPVIPAPTGYVNDRAGVMGGWAEKTEALCREIERQTGAQVAVLTVRTTEGMAPQQYAQRVFDRWKIGRKGKDDGVLILVAVDDRKLWIATGYGVEGALPDGKVGEIRDRYMAPAFRQGRFGEGIHRAVEEIGNSLRGSGESRQRSWLERNLLKLGVLGMLCLLIALMARRSLRWHAQGIHGYRGGWSGGGFGGGGFGGGGFGGFGGGGSGGGGAGGGW